MKIASTLAMVLALTLIGCGGTQEKEEGGENTGGESNDSNPAKAENTGGESNDSNPAKAENTEAESEATDAPESTETEATADESTEATAASAEQSKPVVGELAPDFTTTTQDGDEFHLASFRGKQAVAIVFFPKDMTSGCTKQLCSLRDGQAAIDESGVKVVAVSFESKEAHDAFREAHGLTTPILMDEDKAIGTLYDCTMDWQGMTLPARKTFVINKEGVLVKVIEQVDFDDHGAQILAALDQ